MIFDRISVKQQAREIIAASKPSAITVGAVYLLLSIVIGMLSSRLIGGEFLQIDTQQYLNFVIAGDYEAAIALIPQYTPKPAATLIDFALQLMLMIVSTGYIIFILNTIRKAAPCFGNLLDGFGMAWRIFVLYFLEGLFVALWSMLLIVPGIIAAYRYRQAVYLLIDHPELSPLQCISASKEMMNGHKMELFEFDLSFIGWWLLSLVPVVSYVVQLWTVPYFGTARALYYEILSGRSFSAADGAPSSFEQQ